MAEPTKLFVNLGNGPVGPFTVDQVTQMIRNGMISSESMASGDPEAAFFPIGRIREFAPLFAPPSGSAFATVENSAASHRITAPNAEKSSSSNS